MEIDPRKFTARHSLDESLAHADTALRQALASRVAMLRFLARVASWSAAFGAGVAALSAKVARSRSIFVDERAPVPLADRGVLVASYFFDAARDEFDDPSTAARDTNRCLAQAMIAGMADLASLEDPAALERGGLERLLAEPAWLEELRERVAIGYGLRSRDDLRGICEATGYHLANELTFGRELVALDATLRAERAEWVEALEARAYAVGGPMHGAYRWIRGHAERTRNRGSHLLEEAFRGAALALDHVTDGARDAAFEAMFEGYGGYVRDHREFYARVNEP